MPLKLRRRAGSPHWQITGTVRGVRIRQSAETDREALARERATAIEAEIYRRSIHGDPAPRIAFGTAALSYIQAAGPHAPATIARLDRVTAHLRTATCDEVTQARIDAACSALTRPGSAPATRLREVITPIRAVLTHAARRGWCALPSFETGKPSPKRTAWLTPAEVDRVMAAAAPHLRPLVAFLAATGARLGEALRLEWPEVDLAHARAELRETKNGHARLVDLCPRAVAALANLPGERAGAVFRTHRGRPWRAKRMGGGGQIKKAWAGALRRAEITKAVTPHALRHSWASWHYAVHKDLLLLKRDGDWSTTALCERYAHLTPAGMAADILRWRGERSEVATKVA